MRVITTAAEAQTSVKKTDQRRVLVPTMGALHRGHLELIRIAREAGGADGEVVVSIFVNPLQFEPGSDFERYPRPQSVDEELCRKAGVDLIYRPTQNEMYAPDRSVFVEETSLGNTLEGKSRPGHFRGVCTVVAKLFNVLEPQAAIFGEKDFQQLAIIRRMVRDLNFPIELIGVPIVRESDGLACSSRNQYLSAEERKQATVLHKALLAARELGGTRFRASGDSPRRVPPEEIVARTRTIIEEAPLARIDYVELVDAETLRPLDSLGEKSLLALAVFFGKTRLIDNIQL
jgi:pantoate--beta-alanine ligase